MKKNKSHKCPTCKKTLEHLYDINIHNRIVHKKVFRCNNCDKRHSIHSLSYIDDHKYSLDDILYGGIK